MLPCSLATLRRLSARLRTQSDAGEFAQCCNVCKSRENLRTCPCRTRYCSKRCQRTDWDAGHSDECKAIGALVIWNRREWW
ncbi:hypothetical protein B0H10DRAFT_2121865 [Mycena sp. CBHHK59/15]|nr:hypothetical protein B0H10DRAFT_2121865 [Mycena sp. CBHHK59/15]